ncbi:MAG: carboxymuconolactone decarboxylase family protein [Phycisphaerales bacterium]|nr:MAG: carboxymuconolactone decarboxylase family protein [Phycisphaerales bacterium]
MARLPLIDPAAAQGETKQLFDGPLKGKHLNIFKAMGNSPAALHTYLGMAGALAKAQLSEKEREAIQLAVGEANRCDYCVAAHTKIGVGAGLTEDQAKEARRGKVTSDAKLHALVTFALALNEKRGWVSDDDLQAVRDAGYADAHIAEAVAVFALAIFTNYFNHVAETPVDFPDPGAI